MSLISLASLTGFRSVIQFVYLSIAMSTAYCLPTTAVFPSSLLTTVVKPRRSALWARRGRLKSSKRSRSSVLFIGHLSEPPVRRAEHERRTGHHGRTVSYVSFYHI